MLSVDKEVDESQLKESYKKIIRQYLPSKWGEYEIDEFIEALLKGILFTPYSKYGEAISGIPKRKRWLFSTLPVYDENGNRRIGTKYFLNAIVVKTKKKTKGEKTLKQLREQYENI